MIHLIERLHTMDKVIRVAIACGLAFGLSFIWQAFLPVVPAIIVTFLVGAALGAFAVSRSAPNVLPTYRVEVRPDDYEKYEQPGIAMIGRDELWKPEPRWDDPNIKHLHGVAWYDAEIPPKRHECWAQTDGWIGLDQTQRCACGAIRAARYGGEWFDRNSRKSKVSA